MKFSPVRADSVRKAALHIMHQAQAVITDSHVVYTSGKHGSEYINKDALYTNPVWVDDLCDMIAVSFNDEDIDVVVAPAVGGVNLVTSVTRALREITRRDVRSVYAEHEEVSLAKADEDMTFDLHLSSGFGMGRRIFNLGEEVLIRKPTFVIKRGYDKLLAGGKRTLVVEDVLTTGGSARETVRAARTAGGLVVGVAALCNRGNVTADYLDVAQLMAMVSVNMEAHDEDKCPLCAAGVPINTEVGKGKQFLARKQASQ